MITSKIKLFLVDDHDLVRDGLKGMLAAISDFEVVGESATGENAISAINETKPDVVLMDIKMPGIGGIEASRKVLRFHPELKIIGLSACDEEPFISHLLKVGALGYLTKDCKLPEMELAIRKVYEGQRYIGNALSKKLVEKKLTGAEESPLKKLSQRELQIMMMIVNGETPKAIAEKLNLERKSVHGHRYKIFEKLGIKTDVELAHLAVRYNMLNKEIPTNF